MPSWYAKVKGRHAGSNADHDIAASVASYQVGQLQVFTIKPTVLAAVMGISNDWACKIQGPTTAPLLLKKIEILNSSWTDVNYFSLAIMTVNNGSPSTSNAFIGWNSIIAPLEVWTWEGGVPLIDRYIYAKGAALGLSMFYQAEELDP
jgi:hypothetical protein